MEQLNQSNSTPFENEKHKSKEDMLLYYLIAVTNNEKIYNQKYVDYLEDKLPDPRD